MKIRNNTTEQQKIWNENLKLKHDKCSKQQYTKAKVIYQAHCLEFNLPYCPQLGTGPCNAAERERREQGKQ